MEARAYVIDTARQSSRHQLRFDTPVVEDGYVWWYADAVSDDGQHGITLIAMVGSVFSPYYASARRRGPADPLNYCALNVALYGPRRKYWSMTERNRSAVLRSPDSLCIGPSRVDWSPEGLTFDIEEITVPIPGRLRGQVRIRPQTINERSFALDGGGLHRWWPISPHSRFEVEFDRPGLAWQGTGYVDSNFGDTPLERSFEGWHWSRATLADGSTAILYDVTERRGNLRSLAIRVDQQGNVSPIHLPPLSALPPTGWRIHRRTRSERLDARVQRTLEDTPFYARSLVETTLLGEPVVSVHESLSLRRFESRIVQLMLPFRMPRRAL
jgi:carotenoid 1,2-hydratase